MCKEYKVTGLGKPVEFLVIVMYAKESIRLMNFKQTSYLVTNKEHRKRCSMANSEMIMSIVCMFLVYVQFLYRNYVLRAHCILCLLYGKRDTLQYIKRALLIVLSD
ncbi:hypothetical protein CN501_09445 [Bacillus cereus]|nr:hypothetical protein CN501_09445 [Bacillus cereus]